MSNSLGTLTLDLVAKMGGWVEGFTKAERATKSETRKMQRSIKDVEKSVKSMQGTLTKAAGLLGVTLSVRALDGWIRGSIQAAATTGDWAKKIGTTTEELTALRYIAVQAGSSVGALDGSMLRLNSRLGANFISGGPAAKSLEILNLNYKELMKMPLVEKINAIGEAMQGLDRDIQLRLLQDIAGDSARDLVEMFNMSKDQMDDLTQRAEKLGYVITTETANSAATVLAQINDIKGAFSNLSMQILQDNLPAIEEFLSSITAEDIERSMQIARVAVENLGTAVKSLAVAYGAQLTVKMIASTIATIKSTNAKIREIAITKLQEGATRNAAIAAGRHTVAMSALRVSMGAFGGPLGIASLAAVSFLAFNLSTKKATMSADELDAKLLKLEQTMGSMTSNQLVYARRQLSDQLEEEKKALSKHEKDLAETEEYISVLRERIASPEFGEDRKIVDRNELESAVRRQEEFANAVDTTKQNVIKLKNSFEDATTHLNILNNTASNTGKSLNEGFEKLKAQIQDETNRIGLKSRVATFKYELGLGVKYKDLTPDQIDELEALYKKQDEALSSNNKASSKGINLIDAYTDKLAGLTDETARLVSLNDQLSLTGYESQYNAVSAIRHEIESQNSALSKLSETQQSVLLMKAQELDSQKQINEMLMLGHDYREKIDDLTFEAETYGLLRKEIERLTFYRDLDTQAKIISIGMSEENIAILEEEIKRIKELYDLYEKKVDAGDNDPLEGVKKGINDYIDSFGSLRDQMADFTDSTFDRMGDALADFVTTGKLDFAELTRSILADLAKMMVKMAIVNAMKSIMGGYAEGGLVGASFASGGFTGVGGKYEEAGIVHKNEYVFSKQAVLSLGASNLERLHQAGKSGKRGLLGYAEGGFVSNTPSFIPPTMYQPAPQKSEPIYIEVIVNNEDGTVETNANKVSAKLKRDVEVIVDNRVAHHKKRSGGMLRGR